MEPIRKAFSAISTLVVRLIGTGIGGVLFLSQSFFFAAKRHCNLGIVPVFGQLAFIILTLVGAYFLIAAKFDWRESIEPTPQMPTWRHKCREH
jgi:hypothetical protein